MFIYSWTVICFTSLITGLFVLFIVAWAIFQLSGVCHNYRWKGCKIEAYARRSGPWADRDLYRASPAVTRVISERPVSAVLLAKEQSLPILNVLGLTQPVRAGLQLTNYRLLSESTTTRLRQPAGSYFLRKCRNNIQISSSHISLTDVIFTEVF